MDPSASFPWARIAWRPSDVLLAVLPLAFVYTAFKLGWLSGWVAVVANAIASWIWMGALPLWFLRRDSAPPRHERMTVRAVMWEFAVALWNLVRTVLALTVVVLVLLAFARERSLQASPNLRPFLTEWWQVALFFAAACVIAPVVEELFFRGFLFHALRRWFSTGWAAAAQAALFAVLHPYTPERQVLIFFLGLLLLRFYRSRRTLWAPILVHALFNTASLCLMLLAVNVVPYLGVQGDEAARGCEIRAVRPGFPAEAAGLRIGDVIIALDGARVRNIADLAALVRSHDVGDTVIIEFLRDGRRHVAEAVLAGLRR